MTFRTIIAALSTSLGSIPIVQASFDNAQASPENEWSWTTFRLLAVLCLAFSLYSILLHPEFINPLRHRWLSRNLYNQLVLQKTPAELLSHIATETPNDGLLALREPSSLTLLITRPSILTELLVSRASDFQRSTALQGFFKILTLDGLFTVSGDQHKSLKKRSLPHFSFRAIKNLYPLMWRQASHFASAVEANFNNIVPENDGTLTGTVELSDLTNESTFKVIGTTVFGRAHETSSDRAFDHLRSLLEFFLKPTASTTVYVALTFYSPSWVSKYVTYPLYQQAVRTSAALEKLCLQLVEEKRKQLRTDPESADLASHMIQSGHFTDYEIASQLLTYLVAGQETTAGAINWIYYLLARDARRQSLLRSEIRDALGGFSDVDSQNDLASILEGLPYLNGVINETLRLYPNVPVTQRVAVRDTTLAGFHIPAGTTVYLSPWLIQRSKEVWGPEADQFQPERWIRNEDGQQKLDPSGGMKSNVDYLPFLHGPRNCIGQNFARAELRCLTAALAMRFEWTLETDGDIPLSGVITINPEGGLRLRLKTLSSKDATD
ncbi:P450 monooxygenase [Lecanosticta acicola]|uniref:P450 monooxygenase n=1 Tax=Lecanosticta acicola TaxID=111012 RepID=A0AAI8YSH7_9PEZI|nr:P450 monooxygenase [Lecanosticta acicola]